MKRVIRKIVILFICIWAPAVAMAAPTVYPVKEVFGFEPETLREKSPAFATWLAARGGKTEVRYALGNEFDAAFRKEFGPLAAENITDLNKHETLVASLHLIRSSQYVVPKLGNYEVHLPITLSIVITNPSTGEAIYSFTKTSYASLLLNKPGTDSQAEKLLLEKSAANYRFLLQTLIKEVKGGYNPQKIDITVAKTWKGLYILDKGGKAGIARDDNLVDAAGNEIAVKYVTENYAVAASLLGKVEKGQKFFKYATASTANLFTKPRVLTMHEAWKNQSLTTISYLFDSELSQESAFTLLPVNEYFRKLLDALARDTYSGKFETTQQRAVPDYMLKLSAAVPRAYTMSEKGKNSLNVYEQYILGELLDKQGRVLFSAVGTDRIEDRNVGGMVFDKQARLEVLLKNAVVNLAEQFTRSIKFSHFVLPVKKAAAKNIEVEDTSRELRIGQEVTIYRSIGRVDGISADITIPIWQASVVEADKGTVKLDLILSLLDSEVSVSRDDQVIVDAMTASSGAEQSETSVTYCKHVSPKLGSIDIADFPVISRAFGYRLSYTLYDNDPAFAGMVQAALREGGFKDTLKMGKVDTAGRCLLPVHKASMDKNVCDKGICSHEVSLIAGYRLYVGNDVKGKEGSKSILKTEDCLQNCQIQVIQGDLSKSVLPILRDAILKVRYGK